MKSCYKPGMMPIKPSTLGQTKAKMITGQIKLGGSKCSKFDNTIINGVPKFNFLELSLDENITCK